MVFIAKPDATTHPHIIPNPGRISYHITQSIEKKKEI
jgi:hypothetical protein